MILKFDHISYVSERRKKYKILKDLGEPLFKENNLINVENKYELMNLRQDDHDLYFYDGDIPTEYIFYDSVFKKTKVTINNDTIFGHYNNLDTALDFLNELCPGKVTYKDNLLKCNLRGVLDKKDYYLQLSHETSSFYEKVKLDSEGYGVIALIYKGVKDNERNEKKLVVNGKELIIAFAYTEAIDIIFELIRFAK